MNLQFNGANLFQTKQIWDFCHAKNSVQYIQIWLSRGKREETSYRLQLSESSLYCCFSWLMGFEILMSYIMVVSKKKSHKLKSHGARIKQSGCAFKHKKS